MNAKPGTKQKQVGDLSWLPPKVEWDFRTVTADICHVVSDWEYGREFGWNFDLAASRSIGSLTAPVGGELIENPSLASVPKVVIEAAWLTLSEERRTGIVSKNMAVPPVQARIFRDFMNRSPMKDPEYWRQTRETAYVLRLDFSAGVEVIVKELEAWARREAKKHGRSARAKAAAPPFHRLKWLATRRVNAAAKEHGLKFANIRAALTEYEARHRLESVGDVYPGRYAGQAAWVKACGDAERLGQELISSRIKPIVA